MADDLFEVGEPQQEGLLSFSVPGDDRPLSFERGAESVASFSEGSALQTSQLRAADAFEVFAGKTYESRVGADVSVSTVAPGGGAPSARRRAHEDPVDRYFRLKAEIDELETDLQALSPSPDGDAPQPANVRPNEIWKQMRLELQAMRSRLARVSDSAAIQPLRAQPAKHGAPEPFVTPTVSSDELLRLVSNLRRRADGGVSPSVLETSTMERPGASLGDSSGTGVTYELYCDPRGRGGDGTCARAERLQMLEGRINRLERSIGSHRNVAAQPNIREALTCLESRIDRLDPAAVAAARKELRPLQAQLSKIIVDQKKQEAAATSAAPLSDSSAVQELFRRTQVIDEAGPILPEVMSRLRSLHDLHEQSILWINRLAAVENGQASIEDALKSDREVMELLTESLGKNMVQFTANIDAIEKRVALLLESESGEGNRR